MLRRGLVICHGLAALALSTWVAVQASPVQRAAPPSGGKEQLERLGEEHRVKAGDIDGLLADGKVLLLDVREPWELEKLGTRPGYVNIPLGELEARLAELPKDRAILTA